MDGTAAAAAAADDDDDDDDDADDAAAAADDDDKGIWYFKVDSVSPKHLCFLVSSLSSS